MADRVVVLHRGRVVATGTPDDADVAAAGPDGVAHGRRWTTSRCAALPGVVHRCAATAARRAGAAPPRRRTLLRELAGRAIRGLTELRVEGAGLEQALHRADRRGGAGSSYARRPRPCPRRAPRPALELGGRPARRSLREPTALFFSVRHAGRVLRALRVGVRRPADARRVALRGTSSRVRRVRRRDGDAAQPRHRGGEGPGARLAAGRRQVSATPLGVTLAAQGARRAAVRAGRAVRRWGRRRCSSPVRCWTSGRGVRLVVVLVLGALPFALLGLAVGLPGVVERHGGHPQRGAVPDGARVRAVDAAGPPAGGSAARRAVPADLPPRAARAGPARRGPGGRARARAARATTVAGAAGRRAVLP